MKEKKISNREIRDKQSLISQTYKRLYNYRPDIENIILDVFKSANNVWYQVIIVNYQNRKQLVKFHFGKKKEELLQDLLILLMDDNYTNADAVFYRRIKRNSMEIKEL